MTLTATTSINPYLTVSYQNLSTEADKAFTEGLEVIIKAKEVLTKQLRALNEQQEAYNCASKPLQQETINKIRAAVTPLLTGPSSDSFTALIKNLQDYMEVYQSTASLFTEAHFTVLDALSASAKSAADLLKKLSDDLAAAKAMNDCRIAETTTERTAFEKDLAEGKAKQTALLKALSEAEYALQPGIASKLGAALGSWWNGSAKLGAAHAGAGSA